MTMIETPPAGTLRKLDRKRARPQDDLVADYIATLVRPGDRTLQLGRSQFGATCLMRGAFHEAIGPAGAIKALKLECDSRSVSHERLSVAGSGEDGALELDLAILGRDLGFSALAGEWKQIAARLKVGGVLVLAGADRGPMGRLADALFRDPDWAFQDIIGGDAAIYRKIRAGAADAGLPEKEEALCEPVAAKPAHGLMSGLVRTLFGPRDKAGS